jgi:glycerol-3-phosphate acyltransferase PlsX
MRIAVDAMGGDHAPDAIVKGCLEALPFLAAEDRLVLVGDEAIITDIADEKGIDARSHPQIELVHSTQNIEMHESPVEAVRGKPDSSIVRMSLLGSSRKTANPVDVVISAGNTGACVSAATMYMKRLRGVHRPGIACTIPALHGPVVISDVGANPEPRASHLAQYGIMSAVYAEHVLGIKNPRVAQMNIGSEEGKGTGMIKQVRELLLRVPNLNYVGFIEGRDLFDGAADVVVTDGFVGNTMLKLTEGLSKSLFKAIVHEVMRVDTALALQVQAALSDLIKKNDYHEYGGAPLLGVNGNCFICHGSSEARTMKAAVRVAREHVLKNPNAAIESRLAELKALGWEAGSGGDDQEHP